ncbi:MAG: SRPBCC domain-containing protein [Chloracidobacterium sp.]|nr:SRPBCC domain-containing protein [Chloracidobacterium sp.]
METRSHIHKESFVASADELFDLLVTPSAIRQWWGASSAIVNPCEGGIWTAAWGGEDDPDYISTATLVDFDPPRRLVMKYGKYYAKTGDLPFEFAEDAVTTFTVEPEVDGASLRVEQTGFPCDPLADEFYAACETGWKNTFEGIRKYVVENG